MQLLVSGSVSDWARAIADLPSSGLLPSRTVLVPNSAIRHALQRDLIQSGQSLLGVRFLSPVAAASEALRHANIRFREGEDGLRRARLLALFRERELSLEYFRLEVLEKTLGWEDAFARTLQGLEAAAIRPESLPVSLHPRWKDIQTVWQALDKSAGPSWTSPRILLEAAKLLEQSPAHWPYDGPTLALVSGAFSPALARFLQAIEGARISLSPARPLRDAYLDSVRDAFGERAAEEIQRVCEKAPPEDPKERELLQAYLFASQERLFATNRPRSQGDDGSVNLEEHAGTDEEIEAAAQWVMRLVLDDRLSLDEIAVLSPMADPLATLVAERIESLGEGESTIPVHLADGRPLGSTAGGVRVLSVVRALRSHLDLPSFIEALQYLRLGERNRFSRDEAIELATSLGTAGGHAAGPADALQWLDRLRALLSKEPDAKGNSPESEPAASTKTWREEHRVRQLESLRALEPALEALTEVARLVLNGARLDEIVTAYWQLITRAVVIPAADLTLADAIRGALQGLSDDTVCASLQGDDALRVIEDTLLAMRIPQKRYGEPAVFVGSIASAVGLSFRAVRILGLAEGSLPSIPREDPVLPDEYRQKGLPSLPQLAETSVLEQLHALDRVVREVSGEIVFSFARTDANRTQREPSSIFLDFAAAIGRPNQQSGDNASNIPSLRALERDAFPLSRARLQVFRQASPVSQRQWLERVATSSPDLPSSWQDHVATDLERLHGLESDIASFSPKHGIIDEALSRPLPGMSEEFPISATALKNFFECPYRFLLTNLLGLRARSEAPSGREIDAMAYGSLFHRTAELFFTEHGAAFGEREGSLTDWQAKAAGVVQQSFDEFLESYPLIGEALRNQQRERLRTDFQRFLEYDWQEGRAREFHDVEKPFAEDGPIAIRVGDRSLYVRGIIDRVDQQDGKTIVRDLKTGRCHSLDEHPISPELDIQIALYGIVAKARAKDWGLPSKVGVAYAHINDRTEIERAFYDNFDLLEARALDWLDLFVRMAEERVFPRTTRADDCTYCDHLSTCGEGAAGKSEELLEEASGVLAEFRNLKKESSS